MQPLVQLRTGAGWESLPLTVSSKNKCFGQGWKVIFAHCREGTYKAEILGNFGTPLGIGSKSHQPTSEGAE